MAGKGKGEISEAKDINQNSFCSTASRTTCFVSWVYIFGKGKIQGRLVLVLI